MPPKEKARELLALMAIDEEIRGSVEFGEAWSVPANKYAKECALRAVDEIIKSEPRYPSDVDWDDAGGTHQYYYEAQREEANKFWQEVEQEIEKL